MRKYWLFYSLVVAMLSTFLFFRTGSLKIAEAQQPRPKIALLIGNAAYQGAISPLQNPLRDIETIKKALLQTGFLEDNIIMVRNGGFRAINRAVNRYIRRLKKSGRNAIGFFYYSGHGAVNKDTKVNYLIPIDVGVTETEELWDSSVQLQTIINKLRQRAGNATHFVVFDACRNSLKLSRPGSKALFQAKGFEPVRKVRGMLIAYATADGETAADASAYADALAAEIVRPGIEAVTMFRNVQLKVSSAIGQEPWLTYGRLGRTYFAGKEGGGFVLSPPTWAEARKEWQEVRSSKDAEDLEAYLSRFGRHYAFYGKKAQKRLKKLKEQRVAVGTFENIQPHRQRKPYEPETVFIPGGTFSMGCVSGKGCNDDEKPVHRVTVSKFYMSKYETTFAQWDACVQDGGCTHKPKDSGWGRGKRPVINVSWNDANEYAKWLSGKTGEVWRLPTEAEWEYAARGNKNGRNKTKYSWGNSIDCKKANYGNGFFSENCKSINPGKTKTVGRHDRNGFDLYDMHGNVWEWVLDWYDKNYYKNSPAKNPKGVKSGSDRVIRGGSWGSHAWYLRSANRYYYSPDDRNNNVGFRLMSTIFTPDVVCSRTHLPCTRFVQPCHSCVWLDS